MQLLKARDQNVKSSVYICRLNLRNLSLWKPILHIRLPEELALRMT